MVISSCVVDPREPEEKSTRITRTYTGSRLLKIDRVSFYSQNCGVGNTFTSDTFTVGEYDWSIRYYPAGQNYSTDKGRYIDFDICFNSSSSSDKVTAKFTFTVLNTTGQPSHLNYASDIVTFSKYSAYQRTSSMMTSHQLAASNCLKDDSFMIRCTATIIKEIRIEDTKAYLFTIPQSNLLEVLAGQLETGAGMDVSFKVNGETLYAHSCLLAVSSLVFKSKLFASMKGKTTETIEIPDVEASIFKTMIHFIYTDSVPQFEESNNNREATIEIAQQLQITANQYGLQRLKLICEKKIYEYIDVDNVATILSFTEQHNCTELKAACMKFVQPPEVLAAVVLTEGFENLMKSYLTLLKDLRGNHND